MAKVKLGEVAREYKGVFKGDKAGVPIVGLEHLTPQELKLAQWDVDSENTFTKSFLKGQVLFGRRRAYLKKAAVAPFNGICSGDITVIEAIPGKILPELLPFIIQNDLLFDYAVEKSAGSLSPRVKWEYLKDYEFELPSLERQQHLFTLLKAAYDVRESYKKLLIKTDELVKSQFIEMFGGRGYDLAKANDFMSNMRNGVSPSKSGRHAEKVLTLSAVTQGAFDPDIWKNGMFDECPQKDKRIHTSEFYMCRGNGNKTLVGTAVYSLKDREDLVFPDTVIAARVNESKVLLPYLFIAWKMPSVREQIEASARTTNGTYKINQTVLSNIEIMIPPLEKQKAFVSFVEQIDKSKFELQQAIESLDETIKSLMQQDFS